MARMWQDFRGGTVGDPVTRDVMDPGGTVASIIVTNGATGSGPQITYGIGEPFPAWPRHGIFQWDGTPSYLRFDPTESMPGRVVLAVGVVFEAVPNVFMTVAQIRDRNGALMAEVGVDDDGAWFAGARDGIQPERLAATPGTRYWVQVAVTPDGGPLAVRVEDDAGAVLWEQQWAGVDTGAGPVGHFRAGAPGTNPAATPATVRMTALVMENLTSGWIDRLTPDHIDIRPIPTRRVGPGEAGDLTAELWDGSAADSWTWQQTSGPPLNVQGSGPGASITGPDVWGAGMALPAPGERASLAACEVQVTATKGAEDAPPVTVRVEVLPQLVWTRKDASPWTGGTVAPVCVEPV